MNHTYNLRAITAKALTEILHKKVFLSSLLPTLSKRVIPKDAPLLQEFCFGTLRYLPKLDYYIRKLMQKEFKGKQRPLHYLLMLGLYQLCYTRIPAHAAISETVSATAVLGCPQFKGVINGVLRQFQRNQSLLTTQISDDTCQYLHPTWLLNKIKQNYPEQWKNILDANNQHPPMWLRINSHHHSCAQYLSLLKEKGISAFKHHHLPYAICLVQPQPVSLLPGFSDGTVTIQDVNAQRVGSLLSPTTEDTILDLCCAPGGKTGQILEMAPTAKVLAVDIDKNRLKLVSENLTRLNLKAKLVCGDGRQPQKWAQKMQFEKILLDAPCSATGIIRRHPDIKWLKTEKDISRLVALQNSLLESIWPYLKPKGILLYVTCSILPEENILQIRQFLNRHSDASVGKTGNKTFPGIQYLPNPKEGDGFFYSQLIKKAYE